jgi:CDP-diacylglycerol--glycerol-3-phosphate 3-phosphatidyltransferase
MSVTEPRSSSRAGHPAASGGTAAARSGDLWTFPNLITFSRLLLAVVLFWLIDGGKHWLASCVVFLVAAATDALDGWIARRYGLVTVVGRILDPFVDKVIVGGAFVFLAVYPESGVSAWMAIIVIGREMFITSLRSFLESRGKDFSAAWSGKLKMAVQCAAVAASLLYLEYGAGSAARESYAMALKVLLWAAVAMTLYSGYAYVVRAVQMFREERASNAGHSFRRRACPARFEGLRNSAYPLRLRTSAGRKRPGETEAHGAQAGVAFRDCTGRGWQSTTPRSGTQAMDLAPSCSKSFAHGCCCPSRGRSALAPRNNGFGPTMRERRAQAASLRCWWS